MVKLSRVIVIPHYVLDFEGIMGYNFAYNSFTGEVYHGTV